MAPQLGLQPFVPDPADRPPISSGTRRQACRPRCSRRRAYVALLLFARTRRPLWWLAHALQIAEGETVRASAFMLQAVLLAVLGLAGLSGAAVSLRLLASHGSPTRRFFLLGPLQVVGDPGGPPSCCGLPAFRLFVEGHHHRGSEPATVHHRPGVVPGLNFPARLPSPSHCCSPTSFYRHWPKARPSASVAAARPVPVSRPTGSAIYRPSSPSTISPTARDRHLRRPSASMGWASSPSSWRILLWAGRTGLQDPGSHPEAGRTSSAVGPSCCAGGRVRHRRGRVDRAGRWPVPGPPRQLRHGPAGSTAPQQVDPCRRRSETGPSLPPGPGRRRRPGSRKPATYRTVNRIEVASHRPPGRRRLARRGSCANG